MDKVKQDSNDKFKCTQESIKFSYSEDNIYGCSWPQRNYKCSFCRKEFNSAQALGGHMNIHRHDRAKMRLSPSSCDALNQNPKAYNIGTTPYPNISSSSPSLPSTSPVSRFLPRTTCQTSLPEFSSPSSASTNEEKEKLPIISSSICDPVSPPGRVNVAMNLNKDAFFQVEELIGFAGKDEVRVCEKRETVRLGLDMDLLKDAGENLDLELRLGYP